MPDIEANIGFLADLPAYENEKPYLILLPVESDADPDNPNLTNLVYEPQRTIIRDIRSDSSFKLDTYGAQLLSHKSRFKSFGTPEELKAYRAEVDELLYATFDAEFARCYKARLRINEPRDENFFDHKDPLMIEKPSKAAHVDCSAGQAELIIKTNLTAEERAKYLQPEYRIRIIKQVSNSESSSDFIDSLVQGMSTDFSTSIWRTLTDGPLEDHPLTVCDGRTVDPNDLIPADRVFPGHCGEVYQLKYNPNQKWSVPSRPALPTNLPMPPHVHFHKSTSQLTMCRLWCEHQNSSEPYAVLMYDSAPAGPVRMCPHTSFDNPRASPNAQPRRSVEARTMVITRIPVSES